MLKLIFIRQDPQDRQPSMYSGVVLGILACPVLLCTGLSTCILIQVGSLCIDYS